MSHRPFPDAAERPSTKAAWPRRLLWFALFWALGVGVLALLAFAMRAAIGFAQT